MLHCRAHKSRDLQKKRLAGVKRGGQAKRNQRIQTTREIEERSIMEIGKISPRELFLIDVILYWAEGSKQKEHNPSERVIFSNSDALMIAVFINWLKKVGIPEDQMNISLYIHVTARHRVEEIARYWSKSLKLRINKLEKIYYKRVSSKSFRRNVGTEYYGQVRVTVKKSTNLNRRIHGWVLGITKG